MYIEDGVTNGMRYRLKDLRGALESGEAARLPAATATQSLAAHFPS